jgi:hypothetical protein
MCLMRPIDGRANTIFREGPPGVTSIARQTGLVPAVEFWMVSGSEQSTSSRFQE